MPDNNLLATLLEKAISKIGGNETVAKLLGSDPMEPEDTQFLRQFLRPKEDIMEPQDLRPTQVKEMPNLPFRKMPKLEGPLTEYSVTTQNGQPNIMKNGQPSMLPTGESALGHHTNSIGIDESGPYLSVYDVWDFDSPVIGSKIGGLLNKLGQPYAIYDRYPLQPDPTNPKVFKFKE